MPGYSKGDVILVRYPFSDLTGVKVRPAVVVNGPHTSQDIIIVPLTSRTTALLPGEFVLNQWQQAGLNVTSAAKRGIYTVQQQLCLKVVGQLARQDSEQLDRSLRLWLRL